MLVFNNATLEAPVLHTLTFNLKSPKVRREVLNGKEYLVVPMVMIVQGVHNGSAGPLLYTNDELQKVPAAWDHKPVLIRHPKQGSGCTPEVLRNQQVGIVLNTRFKKDKLHAEAWLDPDRLQAVEDGSIVLANVLASQMMEVSTGLFFETNGESGDWNGEAYNAAVMNIRPDHLAILPDVAGACSIADGAGLLRNNENENLAENQVSHETLRNLVRTALFDRLGMDDMFWIEAMFDNQVVFEHNGQLFRVGFSHTDTEVTLDQNVDEVVRVIEFRTTDGAFVGNNLNQENEMDKTVFVAALIANSAAWEDSDKPVLMNMSEDKLRKLAPTLNDDGSLKEEPKKEETTTVAVETETAAAKTEQKTENAAKQTTPQEPQNLQDFFKSLPPAVRNVLNSSIKYAEKHKAVLIEKICANARNKFPKEILQKMELEQIECIAALAIEETQNSAPKSAPINMAGLGDLFGVNSDNDAPKVEALSLPTFNFERNEG